MIETINLTKKFGDLIAVDGVLIVAGVLVANRPAPALRGQSHVPQGRDTHKVEMKVIDW